MGSKNSFSLCSGSVRVFSPIRNFSGGKNFPLCPYMKGRPCGVFNFRDKSSGCCHYSNSDQLSFDDSDADYVVMFRCCWLPSWVKNGFREAKFYRGVLHGERGLVFEFC